MRARLAAAGIALAVSACALWPGRPDPDPEQRAARILEQARAALVRVEAPAGPPLPMARLLAQQAAAELSRRHVRATVEAGVPVRYVLKGRVEVRRNAADDEASTLRSGSAAAAEDGSAVVRWILTDARGEEVGRHVQHVVGKAWAWEYGDPRVIAAVGEGIAEPVVAMVQRDNPGLKAAGFLAPPPPERRFGLIVAPVFGASAAGNEALTRAIRKALGAADVSVTEDPRQASTVLEGLVELTPPRDGIQAVTITWKVSAIGGPDLGRAIQVDMVPAAAGDDSWRRLADAVATDAVPRIQRVLAHASPVSSSPITRSEARGGPPSSGRR